MVTVEGQYSNIRRFIRDIEKSKQFVVINRGGAATRQREQRSGFSRRRRLPNPRLPAAERAARW
jgi:hypothetical protein